MSEINPYAAPAHFGAVAIAEEARPFYVVASRKFLALYLGTGGMYGIYWSYRHWANFKRHTHGTQWPVARAIFSIFFIHSLLAEIDQRLRRQSIGWHWNHGSLANGIVTVLLVAGVSNRMAGREFGSPLTDWIAVATIPLLAWLKWKVQRAANAACADPAGDSNREFTAANILWLVLGAIFWCLMALGLMIAHGLLPA
jgi:hypothetical protein